MKSCPAHPPGEKPRPATVKIGAREYCDEHARVLLAVPIQAVAVTKAKRKRT